MEQQLEIEKAVSLIQSASAILVLAGAGMSADSGLPTFRSDDGFWNAYPALGQSKLKFVDVATPSRFMEDPRTAWGFYGHRLQLYRKTKPHRGYGLIKQWADKLGKSLFVVTTNVDGHFIKAGFSEGTIWEMHGSIHWAQCHMCEGLWRADKYRPKIDTEHCQWQGQLPTCASCGGIARPNILMFNDLSWIEERAERQQNNYMEWKSQQKNLVVFEIGAGAAIPTLQRMAKSFKHRHIPLIRINPDGDYPATVGLHMQSPQIYSLIQMNGLEAFLDINRGMNEFP